MSMSRCVYSATVALKHPPCCDRTMLRTSSGWNSDAISAGVTDERSGSTTTRNLGFLRVMEAMGRMHRDRLSFLARLGRGRVLVAWAASHRRLLVPGRTDTRRNFVRPSRGQAPERLVIRCAPISARAFVFGAPHAASLDPDFAVGS